MKMTTKIRLQTPPRKPASTVPPDPTYTPAPKPVEKPAAYTRDDAEKQIHRAFKRAGYPEAHLRDKSTKEQLHIVGLGEPTVRIVLTVKGLTQKAVGEAVRFAFKGKGDE